MKIRKQLFLYFIIISVFIFVFFATTTKVSKENNSDLVLTEPSQNLSAKTLTTKTSKPKAMSAENSTVSNNLTQMSLVDIGPILDAQTDPDSRRQALQKLILQGPSNMPLITQIAVSKIPIFKNYKDPHSMHSYFYQFEKNLRITAIETLDQWALSGIDVEK